MIFREWEVWYFDENFTEICSEGPNWQLLSTGMAPIKRQAIILLNAVTINWRWRSLN